MQLALDMAGDGGRLEGARVRLRAAFGPPKHGRRLDPVSQLILAIISVDTPDAVAQAAFYRTLARFGTWDWLRDADPAELTALLAAAARPKEKAAALIGAITAIHARCGRLSLDNLATLTLQAALDWLQALPGVGPEVAARVLNASTLRRPAMIVDAHVLRVSQRLGWAHPDATPQTAFRDWMARLPAAWSAGDIHDMHTLLKTLGQSLCRPKAPACLRCPLVEQCKTGVRPTTIAPVIAEASPALVALRPALKKTLLDIERLSPAAAFGAAPLGEPRIDACFRLGGLPRGRWHEIVADTPDPAHAAPSGFAALLVQRAATRGAVFWAVQRDDLYPPGLQAFGLDPGRVIFVRVDSDSDALSVLENALRTKGVGAVIGEVTAVDLTASKRLQLACECWGTTGFVLRRARYATPHKARAGKLIDASAATTRWRVSPASGATDAPGLGAPRWKICLERNRAGRTGGWIMEHDDATGDVRVVSELADHAAATRGGEPSLRLRDDDARRWRAAAHGG